MENCIGQQICQSCVLDYTLISGRAMPSGLLTLISSIRYKGRIAPFAGEAQGISMPTFRGGPPLLDE